MGIEGAVFVIQRHRWSRLRGRKQWGACVVWAGWGVRHRGSFPKGGLISCTCVRNQSPEMPGARPLFRSFFSDLGQCHFASCLHAPGRARCGCTQLIFSRKTAYSINLATSVRHAQFCACRTHGEILKVYANIAGSLLDLPAGGGGQLPGRKVCGVLLL